VRRVESRHPTDEQLVARYFDAATADDELELHLFRCRPCASRRQELARLLDADHDRTLAAADRCFDEARLTRQRRAVLDRIARPQAQVLRFREASPAAPAVPRAVRSRRWTASAAAAVLMLSVGAGTGWWLDGRVRGSILPGQYATGSQFASATLGHEHQDAVLSAIDVALQRPQTAELLALDDLTPRAGDQPIP
jgi:hypothetical protein